MEAARQFERRKVGPLPNVLALMGWIALVYAAALSGIVFMPGEWYQSLNKPAWNPPNWIFGPVWTTLYVMMGVSAWLVWQRIGAKPALVMFLIQLALNAAWTPVFFGLKNPGAAMFIIVAMWCAIAATIAAFWPRSRAAAYLLFPYLAWVTFASALNFAIWQLN
jgi:tryptophan-rich sensory protein